MCSDTEAAKQATRATAEALEALRLAWGCFYMIGFDDERGWWAARHHRVGHLITAVEPGELQAAMAADHV